MTTRVTEGARRERPSFLASSPLNARAHALPLLNLKKKRGCSQSSQATTSRKAGYAPVVCHRANRLQSAGETITIRSSSRDILPLLSSLKVTYSFLQEIKPWKLKGTAVKLVHWANKPSGRCMFVRISESLIHQSCVVDGIKKNTEAHGNDTQFHINRNIIQAILYNYIIIMYLPKYRI